MTIANQKANFITSILSSDDGSKITTTPLAALVAAPTTSPVTGVPTADIVCRHVLVIAA